MCEIGDHSSHKKNMFILKMNFRKHQVKYAETVRYACIRDLTFLAPGYSAYLSNKFFHKVMAEKVKYSCIFGWFAYGLGNLLL